MRTLKLEISYDGSAYAGWQIQIKQPKVRTIQGELERIFQKITGHHLTVTGSGRTDAGVHALRQIASVTAEEEILKLPAETYTRALNAFLPPDIRIWRTSDVAENFHPIRDVLRKRYRYLMSDSRPFFPFLRNYVWYSTKPLHFESMREAAFYLKGTHDFNAFQTVGSPRKTTIRTVFDIRFEEILTSSPWTIPAQFERPEDSGAPLPIPGMIVFEIEADGFLYNMVRAIAGTLYLFGRRHKGFEDPQTMRTILERSDRSLAGPTAPPHALYMIDVIYPNDGTSNRS